MNSKRLAKSIKGIGSLAVNILILAFIGSFIFGFDIWFVSKLSIVEFILLCVAISLISKGISRIIEPSDSKEHYDNKWQRWENYDYDNNGNKKNTYGEDGYGRNSYNHAPPPPPPPNGSFSSYNPYEKNDQSKHTFDRPNDSQTSDNNADSKDYYKDQAKQFAEQAKQFAHDTKRYAEQKVEEAQQYYDKYKDKGKHKNKDKDSENNDINFEYKAEFNFGHYEQYRSHYDAPNTIYHNMFIGDFKFKENYTQLAPMEINGFISDAHIDLTRVDIPYGETTIRLNCFIGDMKVHVPNDPRIGVKLVISSFIGDGKLFEQKRGGFGLSTTLETPFYHECEKKICIQLNSFIGDAKIKRVG